ncbi:MAG TPA: alternative ribosome rescue aminoacyl-tRNA hydrolase ArfB [Ohtaekwangia sp.]
MSASRTISINDLTSELKFTTSRSSGPGGQNVNKVNTKVTVAFNVHQSQLLTEEEKETINQKLASRLTKEGVLLLSSQDKRSQLENKEAVVAKLEKLLTQAFTKQKKRKTTKPSKSSVQNRIKEKKQHAEKKKWRQRPL